jgi:hypothetical protein
LAAELGCERGTMRGVQVGGGIVGEQRSYTRDCVGAGCTHHDGR